MMTSITCSQKGWACKMLRKPSGTIISIPYLHCHKSAVTSEDQIIYWPTKKHKSVNHAGRKVFWVGLAAKSFSMGQNNICKASKLKPHAIQEFSENRFNFLPQFL